MLPFWIALQWHIIQIRNVDVPISGTTTYYFIVANVEKNVFPSPATDLLQLSVTDPTNNLLLSGGGKIGPDSYLSVAQHLGAWRVFTKPVDRRLIIKTIKEWGESL